MYLVIIKFIVYNFKCQNQTKSSHRHSITRKEKNKFVLHPKINLPWKEHKNPMISKKESHKIKPFRILFYTKKMKDSSTSSKMVNSNGFKSQATLYSRNCHKSQTYGSAIVDHVNVSQVLRSWIWTHSNSITFLCSKDNKNWRCWHSNTTRFSKYKT